MACRLACAKPFIIWTNAWILLIGPLDTNFNEFLIEIDKFSFKKMHFKMSSGKWRPFCLGLNVLMKIETAPIRTLKMGHCMMLWFQSSAGIKGFQYLSQIYWGLRSCLAVWKKDQLLGSQGTRGIPDSACNVITHITPRQWTDNLKGDRHWSYRRLSWRLW